MLKTRLLATTLALAALALPGAAKADMMDWSRDSFYVGIGAGANWADDSDIDFAAGPNVEADFDRDFTGSLFAGFALANGFRPELEIGRKKNDVTDIAAASATGHAKTWFAALNLIYDFDLGSSWANPYAGVGVGYANTKLEDVSTAGFFVDDDDSSYALQAIAGAAFKLTDELYLTGDYRFLYVDGLDYTSAAGANFEADSKNHTVLVGLRYHFGDTTPKTMEMPATPAMDEPATPPPPAVQVRPIQRTVTVRPTPAPKVPNTYLVFFDWDKSTLSGAADQVLATAAGAAGQMKATRIEVTGHADRSGGMEYNQALSLRRAEAVRKALIARGVPATEIAIFAAGETQPLVATADGVREPKNRRVQIVLH